MKKKKITLIILSVLVILASAAWIYVKYMRQKSHPLKPDAMANMDMGDKGQMDMDMPMPGKETNSHAIDTKLGFLLKPTNEYVLSKIPTTSIQNKTQDIAINAFGRIAYDTRQVGSISARITGRIVKLYVRYRFQKVSKGQKVMDIYSPEIVTDEQNLLYLLKNDPENAPFITAAKEKLLLLGMREEQLAQVIRSQKADFTISVYSPYSGHIHEASTQGTEEMPSAQPGEMKNIALITEELPLKEGMYVQQGQPVFSVFDPGKAWVILNFFADKQAVIKKGSPVRIVPETAPGKSFQATIDYIEPFYRKDSKTVTARVYFDNTKLKIPVGSQISAVITSKNPNTSWLPSDALVSLGMDKVVFVKYLTGFKAHRVITGLTNDKSIQILSGLSVKDTVAANAQYLMDSESFIKVNE
ncbi:MAG: copper transporter [Mucilaginibacter sp.]|nr:MAG: copper transporter [Mucilaginibacter sp.]HEK19029.1 efflux RND transporter periplasmic adaptor subunit [Bacteroidota bacterium]